MRTKIHFTLLAALLCVVFTAELYAQGTAFTYQGRLNDGGSPANGTYDLRFILYSADAGGSQQEPLLTTNGVAVSNGLFTVTLDFGADFPGADRWLEIDARTNNAASFVTLSPRQKLTPTPYAITAGNVVNGGLPGTYSSPVTFNNSGNSFTGSGAGLTSLNASSLTSGTVPDARLSTNVALLDRNQTFTGNQTFAGQLILPSPTATIYSGGLTVLHSDGNSGNFFAGPGAGNLIMSGSGNTAVGEDALVGNLNGGGNTANGTFALQDNTDGRNNTAIGFAALSLNTNSYNTAVGADALYQNTSGDDNTAAGYQALSSNTTGTKNTAAGFQALYSNTDGSANTASGYLALGNNTSGSDNTANGYAALYSNITGVQNTASGRAALWFNTNGSQNTADGYEALFHNTSGSNNVANGAYALMANTSGVWNTANGYMALYS
ncbi:MAG TPA: hypothetical protein VKA67_12735, partial [Verrucomicrobiae bacterium]|nr:hypothetical protein [Verrucomicrobiae bacterium]